MDFFFYKDGTVNLHVTTPIREWLKEFLEQSMGVLNIQMRYLENLELFLWNLEQAISVYLHL